jgi:hypothetical protein
MFQVKMEDGSIYAMSKMWEKALEMKYPRKEWDRVALAFQQETAEHWKNKTVPTKFGVESWERNASDDLWFKQYMKAEKLEHEETKKMLNRKFGKMFGMKVEGLSCTCPKGTACSHVKEQLFKGEKLIKTISKGVHLVKQEDNKKVYIVHEHGDTIDKECEKISEKWRKIVRKSTDKEVKKLAKEGKISYQNQAELGHDVMYSVLRVPIMSLALEEMSKEEKTKNKIKIIGLNDEGGATVYEGKKVKKVKDVQKYLLGEEKDDRN